jgi:hypothetical protein
MRYMMLIYNEQNGNAQPSAAERAEMVNAHMAFAAEMTERGVMKGGEELHPAAIATTIRVRDGGVLKSDGPYAETKEQLGGYYLLNCADLDEAIDCASKIPTATSGSVEIRPIVEWE